MADEDRFIPYPGWTGGVTLQTGARKNLSVNQSINIFPHRDEEEAGKGEVGMISRPGYELFGTAPVSSTGRALIVGEQRMWSVIADTLYEVDSAGTYTAVGIIGSGSSPCPAEFNGTQLAVLNPDSHILYVSGERAIIAFADAGGLVEVTFAGDAPGTGSIVVFSGTGAAGIDGSQTVTKTGTSTVTVNGSTWPGGTPPAQGFGQFFAGVSSGPGTGALDLIDIFYLDGYLFGIVFGTNEVRQSAQFDFTVWDPANDGVFVASTDRLQDGTAYRDGIALVGSSSTQYVSNSGAAGFVLAKIQSSFIPEGTCAPHSPMAIDEVMIMVGGSKKGFGRVVMVQPGRVTRISNYSVEQELKAVTDFSLVTGDYQQWEGHRFYILTLGPTGNQWWYDLTEKSWHRQAILGNPAYGLPLGRFHGCTFNNRYFCQQIATGQIWRMRTDGLKKDNTVVFRAQRTAPVLYNGDRFNVNEFRVDMQAGPDGTTANQVASMRYSVNGGLTYGSYVPEIAERNGEEGVISWPQLGQVGPRGFVADVIWDGDYDIATAGARVDVSPGMA